MLELAEAQLGVVARWQLMQLGFGEEKIDHWVRTEKLCLAFTGVYCLGHTAIRREGWFIAAVLAAGEGSVLSHRSAAFHWGLLSERGKLIDVTTPRRSQDGIEGIRLHRPRSLDAEDLTQHKNIPITTVGRTLIDLAHGEPEWIVRRAWDQAEMAKRLDPHEVAAAVERAGPRRGIRKVKRLLLLTRPEGIERVRSGLEIAFLRMIENSDVARPQVNVRVLGWEVDFCWPDQRVILETDGGPYHSTPLRRIWDAERDHVHKQAGYLVLRVPDTDLNQKPGQVLADVRNALNSRRGPDIRR